MPVPPSRATFTRRHVERGSQGSYLPFFFLAAFFFFLATVHPPLKIRQSAADRCNQCSGAERHVYKVDQAPTAERPRASGRQLFATTRVAVSVTRDRLINSFLK